MPIRLAVLMATFLLVLVGCARSPAPFIDDPATPLASTQYGRLSGVIEADSKIFRGIPYAQPPVGDLRWQPPLQPEQWEGVRSASTFGFSCPQKQRLESTSEDCLTLNIATPLSATTTSKLPVLVWVHGGGFVGGSGSSDIYNADLWNANDIVLVTLNYRLGALGFFAHPALEDEHGANYGLMDMVAALEWVKANIEGFGGDSESVTVAGLSAGGMAVNLLMVAPQAKGLFKGAIAHSGYGTWPLPRTNSQSISADFSSAELLGQQIVERATLNLKTMVTRAELNAITAEQFTHAISGFHLPIVDGISLAEETAIMFARGQQHPVPFVSGGSSYDGSVFPYSGLTEQTVLSHVDERKGQIPDLWQSDYSISDELGFNRFFGDLRYLFSGSYSTRQMKHANQSGYLYMYDYVPVDKQGQWPGAPHGSELRGLFNDQSTEVAKTMRRYWVNFIKTGNPNGKGLSQWPAVSDEKPEWMVFSDRSAVEIGVRQKKMDFLELIYSERVNAID